MYETLYQQREDQVEDLMYRTYGSERMDWE